MQRIPRDSCPALNCPESQQIPLSHSCCKVCKGKVIYKLNIIFYSYRLQIDFFSGNFEQDTRMHDDHCRSWEAEQVTTALTHLGIVCKMFSIVNSLKQVFVFYSSQKWVESLRSHMNNQ